MTQDEFLAQLFENFQRETDDYIALRHRLDRVKLEADFHGSLIDNYREFFAKHGIEAPQVES